MARSGKRAGSTGYQDIRAEMKAGRFRGLYVLYGEETFLIEKIVQALTDALIAPGSQSLDKIVLDGGGQPTRIDPDRLQAELMTPPFLSSRKLVIVKNSGWLLSGGGGRLPAGGIVPDTIQKGSENGDDQDGEAAFAETPGTQKSRQDRLAGFLEHLPDSVCLVMIETKVDRRLKNLVDLISRGGILAEISQQDPAILLQWVVAECRQHGLTIETSAGESLVDRCDASMQVIWQELSKIFLYCSYTGCTKIDADLVGLLSLPDLRGNIFDLTDALAEGRTERAIWLVDTLIGQKEPVQLIQFMLARHLRQLICAAELGKPDKIGVALKVMPFIASRLAAQARRLPLPVLEDLYGRCVETDTQVKSGRINDRLALEALLVEAAELIRSTVRR